MTDRDVNQSGPGENTRLQKWVDPAMYAAEPVPSGGPRVHLLWATPDPLGVVAAAATLYTGTVRRSLDDVTHAERRRYLAELHQTKIKAPLEFVQFHFLLEGVTRGFTHQLVRQRTATFVQESTRFAVKEDMPVGRPPSIADMTEEKLGMTYHDTPRGRWAGAWDDAVQAVNEAYDYLIATGMPAEDARGLLPTNLLTRVHWSTDLRALLDHAGNRLCTQAQFEWRLVFAKVAQAIREYDPLENVMRCAARAGAGEDAADLLQVVQEVDRWQWEALADLLRPICYQTGKCEFNSGLDRACSIRDRVQARAQHGGRDTAQWYKPFVYNDFNEKTGRQDTVVTVPGIEAREWLADPGAAR